MAYTQVQLRRDTTTNWSTNDPVLATGELAIDTTLKKIKVGDGSNNWSGLPFVNDGESIILYLSPLDVDIAATTKAAIIPYLPYNLEVSELVLEVDTAPTGSNIEVDINVDGVSFLTTVISIDATETSSTTAATPYAIDTTTFPNSRMPKGSTVTVDIDQPGTTVAGQNLVLVINGVRY